MSGVWGTAMNASEKKSFLRFMSIYLAVTGLLFAAVSLYYYYDQTQQIEDTLARQMREYGSLYRNGKTTVPSSDFRIELLPKKALPYPAFLEANGTYVSTSCGGMDFPGSIIAVSARPETIASRTRAIKIKIALFMAIAFIVNLLAAFVLAHISLRPVREKNREFREFVDDIVHDLNAPISAISINLESLLPQCDEKKIVRIGRSVDTIRNLYSNLEVMLRSRYKSTPQTINVMQEVSAIVDQLRPLYPEMRFVLHPSPVEVTMDTFAFERIVVNLVQNASKYTEKEPVVTIGIDERHRLYIADNGIGIETPQRLLERARQSSDYNPGYGLGLTIVKKLSEECGIPFTIRSKPGKGTIFYFDLTSLLQRGAP